METAREERVKERFRAEGRKVQVIKLYSYIQNSRPASEKLIDT